MPEPTIRSIVHCYDFPEVVVHSSSARCPRYTGGVCHPLPTPVEPYNEDEARAVEWAAEMTAYLNGGPPPAGTELFAVRPSGSTILPDEQGKA